MNNSQEFYEPIATSTSCSPLQNTETAALAYSAAGLSVLPITLPDKSPIGISTWTEFQSRVATPDEIHSWFAGSGINVALICGNVSGSLEVIDFDENHNLDPEPLFDRFRTIVDQQSTGLIDRLTWETSMRGGIHLYYRCAVIEGSRKLAMRPPTLEETKGARKEGKTAGPVTLIETRGEKGYVVCAPSEGYSLIHGSLTAIARITPDERELLIRVARSLSQVTVDQRVFDAPPHLDAFDKRPGDDFNVRGNVRPMLTEYGWKKAGRNGDREYWRRPGKTEGVSATLQASRMNGRPYFDVYSTNAYPLEAGRHSLFSVLAHLKFAGDWSRTAAALAAQGFGSTTISEAEDYLRARYDFRYNVITGKPEFRTVGSQEYEEMHDFQLNSMYRELQKFHIKIGSDALASVLHSDFAERFDPFTEYYVSLPPWDGEDHIDALAKTVKLQNQADNDIFCQHLTKWLVNAVACAIEERVANHNALILVGPQGRYKTTWLNRLVPKSLDRYKFIGTINPENKDTLIHLSECYLINLDELETLSKHDLGSLKSIMTLERIRVRRPYGRIAENLIRRASFVGSINRSEFLNDETGTRRFLTHAVESINLSTTIDMDKVHAQAYHLLKSGYEYWFNASGIQSVNTHNEQFAVTSTEMELVSRWFRPATEEETKNKICDWKTATDVAVRAHSMDGYSITKSSARDFGIALKAGGFPTRKSDGKRLYAVMEMGAKGGQGKSGELTDGTTHPGSGHEGEE